MATIKIEFPDKNSARGTLKCLNGSSVVLQTQCLGKLNYAYPKDCTINAATDKENPHYSREFQCDMPYAIRVDGTKGIYIHEDVTSQDGNLSHRETHGCINIAVGDAAEVFNWVTGRTRILISYKW